MGTAQIVSFEVKRRTFEGKTDPSKNDHASTSKYMTSYRYIALYKVKREYDDGGISEREEYRCFRSKAEAEQEMLERSRVSRF